MSAISVSAGDPCAISSKLNGSLAAASVTISNAAAPSTAPPVNVLNCMAKFSSVAPACMLCPKPSNTALTLATAATAPAIAVVNPSILGPALLNAPPNFN